MSTKRIAALAGLAAAASLAGAAAGEVRDYNWFLRQAMSLQRLPYLEEAVVSRQFSSYHRASRYDRELGLCVGMDANGDAGHSLTIHAGPKAAEELKAFKIPADAPRYAFGDLQWVLDPLERNHVFFLPRNGVGEPKAKPPKILVAAIGGPGCICRIWSANPTGTVRFYFDGSTTPVELDFKGIFLKGASDPDKETLAKRRQWPFIRPMTYRRSGDQNSLASDCYLPIPFAKSCLIELTRPSFYQFGYKQFPKDTQVQTFRLPLTKDEDAVLAEVCRKFLARGVDPKPTLPNTETLKNTVVVLSGQTKVIADLKGPRIIQAVHARLKGNERYAHSKVLITAEFDGEPKPSVWCPLVNFFGTGFEPRDYRSYPLGFIDGEGYCYFPMPFRTRARVTIINEGQKECRLTYRIVHAPVESLPPNTMHFKAKYRREPVCKTFDYPFIEATGTGRFLGASLCIDDAWRSWWGEGDEKIWVDGDVFPSFFGTGSEDYFGDAWGIRTLHETFFACSSIDHRKQWARTCCYRWMVPDDVPFRKSIRATIENYPENIWGARAVKWDEDYVSVAYWYQMPGGSDFFKPVPVGKRRPWGKVPRPPVVEAEDEMVAELDRGARFVDDEGQPFEYSRGVAIDLRRAAKDRKVDLLGPNLLLEGPYTVTVHTRPGLARPAKFDLYAGDAKIGSSPPDYGKTDAAQIGFGLFERGRTKLTLHFTSAGAAVFDAIQLAPARQLRDVVEAEAAKVVQLKGPKEARDVGILWSGGRQLRFPAARPDDAIELEAPLRPGRWHVCVGHTRGPSYGDYDVFLGDKKLAALPGYAPKDGVRDWVKLAALTVPNKPMRFRFVCTGKHAKATGHALGLDYIGWQRIVVEGAIEGEGAKTVDVKHGRFVPQRLGPRFSGGHHLWFHPAKEGAEFTWLLDCPADGRYELCVYFTHSHDYAIVGLALNGKDLGKHDTYAPTVVWAGRKSLGVHDLKKGPQRLTFTVVGRNPKSKGILVGVDCLTLKPKH